MSLEHLDYNQPFTYSMAVGYLMASNTSLLPDSGSSGRLGWNWGKEEDAAGGEALCLQFKGEHSY